MSEVRIVDAVSLPELIASSDLPVVVDFWAEWCGPCRAIAPVLAELAAEHAEDIVVAKLNIDENPETARDYEVMSIPTLIVFKDGAPAQRLIGAKPKDALKQELGLG